MKKSNSLKSLAFMLLVPLTFSSLGTETLLAYSDNGQNIPNSISKIIQNISPSMTTSLSNLNHDEKVANSYTGLINKLLDALQKSRTEIRTYALSVAKEISSGYNISWRDAVPEIVWNNRNPKLRVTLYGKLKLKVLRDKNVRLTLDFQPDQNFYFRYLSPHKLHVSRCRFICKKKRKKVNRLIAEVLDERKIQMENKINERISRIIQSTASNNQEVHKVSNSKIRNVMK